MTPDWLAKLSSGKRFLREARMAASLTHPHVITIHDVGDDGGQQYMAMEYLPSSLHGLLNERGALPVDETLGIIRQVASALNAAHESGIVHRISAAEHPADR